MSYTAEQIQENRKAWVAALRSGKYKQTTECLRDDSGYCCLGVACEISKLSKWDYRSDHKGSKNFYEDDNQYLPTSVQAWLDIGWKPTVIDEEGIEKELAVLNDEEEYDFDELADLIEAQYLAKVSA